jgi:hypothetical protein
VTTQSFASFSSECRRVDTVDPGLTLAGIDVFFGSKVTAAVLPMPPVQ